MASKANFAQVAVSMLKQYIVQRLRRFTSGAASGPEMDTAQKIQCWKGEMRETFQGYSTSLHAGLTEHTGPFKADGLAWLRVALGFCSPECCLHASDSKSFPPAAIQHCCIQPCGKQQPVSP